MALTPEEEALIQCMDDVFSSHRPDIAPVSQLLESVAKMQILDNLTMTERPDEPGTYDLLCGTDVLGTVVAGGSGLAALVLTKTELSTGPYSEGDVIQYQIVVENVGTDPALNVVLTDTLADTWTSGPWDGVSGVNIAPGSSETQIVEHAVTGDEQVAASLVNTATAVADNADSVSGSITVTDFNPWSTVETADPGNPDAAGNWTGSWGAWTTTGSVDLALDGAGMVRLGGAGSTTSPVIAIPAGITQLEVGYNLAEEGTLEATDTYDLEITFDNGATWTTVVAHANDGVEVGSLVVPTGGSTTAQLRVNFSNNVSAPGGDNGTAEAVRILELSLTQA